MITVTIAFKGSDLLIVLGFNTIAKVTELIRDLPDSGTVRISDEFGQISIFDLKDILSLTVTDLAKHGEFENGIGLLELERDQKFQVEIGKRPDLKFLVGTKNPLFDRKK